MIIEKPWDMVGGNAGFFRLATLEKGPVVLRKDDIPMLVFMDGYRFAAALGMDNPHSNPITYIRKEGAITTLHASEFRTTKTIKQHCDTENVPIIIKKHRYKVYVAMNPEVFNKYRHLFSEADSNTRLTE